MRTSFVSIVLLLLCTGEVAGQTQAPHICGAGPGPNEVAAGVQPGGHGIAPTPLCYWKSQQTAPQPTGYWQKTWGAIAPSSVGGVLGTAVGAGSKREAKRLALADCQAKGGRSCRVDVAYQNQCVSMVTGDKTYSWARAASVAQATKLAMDDCNKDNESCDIYYFACTEPIFYTY